jgi:tetratricopeptide (TPR) repeat protein
MKRYRLVLLASIAVLLVAVMYFLPRQTTKPEAAKQDSAVAVSDPSKRLAEFKKQLTPGQKIRVDALEKLIDDRDDTAALDSLGQFWDKAGVPYLSSYYFGRQADASPSEKHVLIAASRYFDAYKAETEEGEKKLLMKRSMAYYEKALGLNPENLDARCDLGVLYAEGSSEPMKGITMLREVIEKNPGHENAQFNLGILSVKSGQIQKAIERFEKVIEINPQNYDAYLFTSQIHLDQKDTLKAVEVLKNLKKIAADPRIVRDVDKLIVTLQSE